MCALGAIQSRMLRQMQVLKQAGLLVDRHDAQWVGYRRNPDMAGNVRAPIDAAPMEGVAA
jgi:ArsR family transcriptional regulator